MFKHLARFSMTYMVFAVMVIVSLYYRQQLPENMIVQWGLNDEPSGIMARDYFLVTLTVVPLLINWFVIFIMGRSLKARDQKPDDAVISNIALLLMMISAATLFWVIYANIAEDRIPTSDFVTYVFAATLILLGNIMRKIKPNMYAGFRLPWTLKSEKNWEATHRFGGWWMIICGALMVGLSFVFSDMIWVTINATFWFTLAIIGPCIYSFTHHKKHG